MNGRKPKRHGAGVGDSDVKSSPFRWINIPLGSEDFAILEREEANLEQLALAYLSVGVQRFGLSVKYDSVRESFTVSIYGSDTANNMQPCGVSGAAANLRDALLVSLYKFNTRLQGSFDGCTTSDTVLQSERFK